MVAALPGAAAMWAAASPAAACSVCSGDPQSPLAQGAVKGVLVMLIITYVAVGGLLAMPIVWAVRARRLRRQQAQASSDDAEHAKT